MKKTTVQIPNYNFRIDHHKPVCFLGSCFSENMSSKFKKHGFHIAEDPYGIIYNPFSLAQNIKDMLDENVDQQKFFEKDGVYFSWQAHSKVYGISKSDLLNKLTSRTQYFSEKLSDSEILFITFGTAFYYQQKSDVVGNCHKFPQKQFKKKLLSVDEIVSLWEPVLKSLPTKKVIFTVSPVRHVKDGLIENNRSKSILLEAVHQFTQKENAFYFPSYEIVIDELRDYAYFGKDGVHPNEFAIDYIWDKVQSSFFTEETQNDAQEFHQLYQLFQHKILFPESKSAEKFEVNRQKKLEHLKKEKSYFNFDEIDILRYTGTIID